ncbi:MAG: hybrid sensor histidine kinase/response regulator [Myxococcota bacterium]
MRRSRQIFIVVASIAGVLAAAAVQHLVVLGTTIAPHKLAVPFLVGASFGGLIVMVLRTRAALQASRDELERQRAEIATLNQRLSETVRSQGAELKSAEQKLVEANRLGNLGLLSSGVAHDFNNLLTVTLAGSTWLLQECQGEQHEVVESILSASERGAALTRQLLALARPQKGGDEVQCLNRALTQLQPLLARLAGPAVDLALEPCGGELPVPLSRTRLEQVLLNLVVNARDAMPRGGRLTFATSVGDASCRLRVKDEGVGMSPEVQARIFEPFFTTKGAGRGTGLGLAIVRDAVQSCGGDIAVDSAPGQGTTFTLTLPLRDTGELETTPPVQIAPSAGLTVLFVDAEEALRRIVGTLLADAGLRVLTASGQREALERVAALRASGTRFVLITDVVLADGDGVSLAHEVRRTHGAQPVVLTSTFGLAEVELPAFMLPKPFTASRLLDAIARTQGGPG